MPKKYKVVDSDRANLIRAFSGGFAAEFVALDRRSLAQICGKTFLPEITNLS